MGSENIPLSPPFPFLAPFSSSLLSAVPIRPVRMPCPAHSYSSDAPCHPVPRRGAPILLYLSKPHSDFPLPFTISLSNFQTGREVKKRKRLNRPTLSPPLHFSTRNPFLSCLFAPRRQIGCWMKKGSVSSSIRAGGRSTELKQDQKWFDGRKGCESSGFVGFRWCIQAFRNASNSISSSTVTDTK